MNTETLLNMIATDEVREVAESKRMYYYVDRLGNVYSLTKVKQIIKKLNPYNNGHGYLYIRINKQAKSVHRLVYETFNGAIPEGYCINHIDGNKQNNRCTNDHNNNLEAITMAENNKHARDNGLNQGIQLTYEQRLSIANTFDKDKEKSLLSISKELNIDYLQVYRFIKSYEKQQYKRLIEDELNKGKAIIEMNRNQLQITNTLSTSERIKVDFQNRTKKANEEKG